MQQWLKTFFAVSIATLISVTPAFANVSPTANLEDDLGKIQTWTTHLNGTYPSLSLSVIVTVNNELVSRSVLKEINQLKDVLSGAREFPPGSFKTLECSRLECTGQR